MGIGPVWGLDQAHRLALCAGSSMEDWSSVSARGALDHHCVAGQNWLCMPYGVCAGFSVWGQSGMRHMWHVGPGVAQQAG